jgi:hypothetical protein
VAIKHVARQAKIEYRLMSVFPLTVNRNADCHSSLASFGLGGEQKNLELIDWLMKSDLILQNVFMSERLVDLGVRHRGKYLPDTFFR